MEKPSKPTISKGKSTDLFVTLQLPNGNRWGKNVTLYKYTAFATNLITNYAHFANNFLTFEKLDDFLDGTG